MTTASNPCELRRQKRPAEEIAGLDAHAAKARHGARRLVEGGQGLRFHLDRVNLHALGEPKRERTPAGEQVGDTA